MSTSKSLSIFLHLSLGLVIRLAAVAYSVYHDVHNTVKYTDIDYSVYSDAAAYIVQKESPYRRETYRYTPLLAYILTPVLHTPSYGKILFSLFDILTSYLIYCLALVESGGNKMLSSRCTFLWIYNPLPIAICSRGSSESIILSLVLATLYLVKKNATGLAGVIYGFAVHFKIYPIAHCLPLYLCTCIGMQESERNGGLFKNITTITRYRAKLVLGAIFGFAFPTYFCYYYYGDEFLKETYFYHLTRKDIRHNFSSYFYMMYLNCDAKGLLGLIVSLITFAPQVVLLVGAAALFRKEEDLCFTVFVQTFCFVNFNKVCTSQYFLWYLSLLPAIYGRLNMKLSNAVILLFVWYFAQIAWLLPAYFLEFEGRNAFMYVWLESIAFFCANVGILVQIIKKYKPQ